MENHFGLEVFDTYNLFKNRYMYDGMIMETNISVVYEVIDIKEVSSPRYAMKVIPIQAYNMISDKLSLSFAASHSNIITTFNVLFDSETNPKFAAYLMELGYGDLITLQRNTRFSELDIKKIIYDTLQGLKYLHGYHICHHNIKLENIIAKSYNEPRKYAICDFACALKSENDIFEGKFRGTVIYSAPEILKNSQYTNKIDIWSLGVVMYTLLAGKFPYGVTDDIQEMLYLIENCELDLEPLQNYSGEAIDLIHSMMCINPDLRLSAEEALRHPWFSDGMVFDQLNDAQLNEIQEIVNSFNS